MRMEEGALDTTGGIRMEEAAVKREGGVISILQRRK